MLLGCVFEFLIANTFSSVVFGLYGMTIILEIYFLALGSANYRRNMVDCGGDYTDPGI